MSKFMSVPEPLATIFTALGIVSFAAIISLTLYRLYDEAKKKGKWIELSASIVAGISLVLAIYSFVSTDSKVDDLSKQFSVLDGKLKEVENRYKNKILQDSLSNAYRDLSNSEIYMPKDDVLTVPNGPKDYLSRTKKLLEDGGSGASEGTASELTRRATPPRAAPRP